VFEAEYSKQLYSAAQYLSSKFVLFVTVLLSCTSVIIDDAVLPTSNTGIHLFHELLSIHTHILIYTYKFTDNLVIMNLCL
jgi:hypothetical protein